jgi:hypothetical protein
MGWGLAVTLVHRILGSLLSLGMTLRQAICQTV